MSGLGNLGVGGRYFFFFYGRAKESLNENDPVQRVKKSRNAKEWKKYIFEAFIIIIISIYLYICLCSATEIVKQKSDDTVSYGSIRH